MTSSASTVQDSPSTGKTQSCQVRRAEAKAKSQLALADSYVRKAGASTGNRAGLLMRRANSIRTVESEAARARASL